MRQRIELVNKSRILHTIVNDNENKANLDTAYMCIELLLTLWKSIVDNRKLDFNYPRCFSEGTIKEIPNTSPIDIPIGLRAIESIYEQSQRSHRNQPEYDYYYSENSKNKYIHLCDIWGIILFCMAEISDTKCTPRPISNYSNSKYTEYIKKYWNALQIII